MPGFGPEHAATYMPMISNSDAKLSLRESEADLGSSAAAEAFSLIDETGLLSETETLTKAELAELLFEVVGLNKREAKEVVDIFFEEIRETLIAGQSVKLSGFGNFQLRDKPQRPGRNPKTGESIPIAARRVVTFHASQKLKSYVQDPESQPLDAYADDDAASA
jgi:integration host factor subunit alpha